MIQHCRLIATCLVLAAVLTGCSTTGSDTTFNLVESQLTEDVPSVPPIDGPVAAAGMQVYLAHCSTCHGVDLAGATGWQTPDSNGNYPPPPLDNSGHAWHHSTTLLTDIIRDGSSAEGSAMVGFSNRLSEAQIAAVVEYLRSAWGPQEREFQWLVTWQEIQRDR